MKRLTVRRELNKRLREEKFALGNQRYKELVSTYGGTHIENVENQWEINMMNDVNQIEFLLWCLTNRGAIEKRRILMIEKK